MNSAWSRGAAPGPALLSVASASDRPDAHHYSFRRGIVGTAVFAFGLFIYTRVQLLSAPRLSFELPIDREIPFVPEMIVAYTLFFFFVPAAAFAADRERWGHLLVAAFIAAPIGWACFLLLPASFARPDTSLIGSEMLSAWFGLLYLVDDSHNTFPSLHVAITWIACLGFRGTRLFWPALVIALLICSSTAFVKQHTVLDVLGGSALAAFSLWIATRSRSISEKLLSASGT
jgi:membrane-associated phospholipid phosphatase